MTNNSRRARLLALPLVCLLALGAVTSLTACKPRSWSWRLGATHGAIIEATAGRGSLGIYRVPRKALRDVYGSGGIRQVQDYIWAVGQPPVIHKTFRYRGRSFTTSFGTAALRNQARSLIYDRSADLRAALFDAHSHHDCLALTLISYGKPTANWTHKEVGCQMGALG